MKRVIGLGTWVVLAGLGVCLGRAQQHQNLDITPAAGKWMICVTSYSGPDAGDKAYGLASEMRTKNRLPVYLLNRGAEERRKQKEQLDRIRKMTPGARPRFHRIRDQFAVMIGGYNSMESARKDLERIKSLPAPSDRYCSFGEQVVPGKENGVEGVYIQKIKYNPFKNAFVVPNPTVPRQAVQQDDKPDPMLKHLNAREKYSLLKCSKPWTLVVATFQGSYLAQGSSDSGSFMDKLLGRNPGRALGASALNARNMAEALRKLEHILGHKSYVLHTRYYSVVSLGEFDSENDPRIRQLQDTLQRRMSADTRVKMLPQPLPMQVPRS